MKLRPVLAALGALALSLPAFAQAPYNCSALEITPGQYGRTARGDKAVVGRFFYTPNFIARQNGYSQEYADEWRKHLLQRFPDIKGEYLVTDCYHFRDWRSAAQRGDNFTLGGEMGEGRPSMPFHNPGEIDTLPATEVPYDGPPPGLFEQRKATAPPKWYLQCGQVMGSDLRDADAYDQGASMEKTRVFEFAGRSEAYEARSAWMAMARERREGRSQLCSMVLSSERAVAGINAFQNKHRAGIPVTVSSWTPPVPHAEPKPAVAGKPAPLPSLTVEGPSKSDKEFAAREKARLEKAAADEKKAQAAQAQRDAEAKAADDKLKADAAAIKAKAQAVRAAALSRCASRGISPEKCPMPASAQ